ncbi:transmembrane protein 65 [Scomber japonicus]|uniref:transmembrane protein 65 n=1 Tax=Scomber japonicus TaxID=13676 RepID=UPI0023050D7A|nr:transmembrane protein 65 [Scomber japonicus]
MFKLCLHKAVTPVLLKLTPGVTAPRLPGIGRLTPGMGLLTPGMELHTPARLMGTHGRNEPREPLNSPLIAKDFIYRLQPKERACLLKELQSFESIAIAQEIKEFLIVCVCCVAAAALGNLVSDLAGLGLAGYVEALASRLGMQVPDLTPKQADMWQSRVSSHMGKAIGVSIGCILGMFPLLFLSDDDDKEKENKDESAAAAAASLSS